MSIAFDAVIEAVHAQARMANGARLIDVREAVEHDVGAPLGSRNVPVSQLDSDAELANWPSDAEIILICATGRRSQHAAAKLRERGFVAVASVEGGFTAWRTAGLPERPNSLDRDSRERYARQLILPEVGARGQRRLANARVLIVGAGGLGSPVAFYLAAAGVGHLRIVDPDSVERSNLHRQILHRDADVATAGNPEDAVSKVRSAHRALAALNPCVQVEAIPLALDAQNAADLARDADVLVDGADNFAARQALNAAAIALGKPLVYGAVHRFEGQASVFWPARPGSPAPCYRCLFPESPPAELAPSCAEAGVLGVVPGLIGLIQATETLKLLLGFGETLCGRLLVFDARSTTFRDIAIPRDPACHACGVTAPTT